VKATDWHGKLHEGMRSVPAGRLLVALGGTLLVTAECGSPTTTHAGSEASTSRAVHPPSTSRPTPSVLAGFLYHCDPDLRHGELVLAGDGAGSAAWVQFITRDTTEPPKPMAPPMSWWW
jgi:hypothetical protein